MTVIKRTMKVTNVIDETQDTRTIRLDSGEFDFKPGQFVMINVECEADGENKLVKRAYSISSPPTKKGYIDLTVKIYNAGLVSKKLYNMKVGDEFEVSGPYGHFTFDENLHKNIVLIGGGVGVTPLMCMTEYIKDKNLDINVNLIYSSKTPKDIIFKDKIMKNRHKKTKMHLTITRPVGHEWGGMTGRIDEKMIKKIVKDLHLPYYFLCGPTIMVEETAKLLKGIGIDDSKIKLERFG